MLFLVIEILNGILSNKFRNRKRIMFKKSLMWFRRDLRINDNRALAEACALSQEVIPVFVFDTNILSKLTNKQDKRMTFLYESLKSLSEDFSAQECPFLFLHGDPVVEIEKIAKKLQVDAVFTNKDYEPYAKTRDHKIEQNLKSNNISFFKFKDQLIFEEKEILNGTGFPYKVFTPYKNAWKKSVTLNSFHDYSPNLKNLISKKSLSAVGKFSDLSHFTLSSLGFEKSECIFKPGTLGAIEKWNQFKCEMSLYDENRNNVDVQKTSQLSIYLRFGLISIRELFRFLKTQNSKGAEVWASELIWREFYQMILSEFPYVAKSCFKTEYDSLKWEGSEKEFKKWCEGQTGFPIIDAAMRCFNQTGWMHNRLRMIVASFLVKDLLVNYRKGEEYFAQNLLDFDLASNNGGWQWCASTGCDAQPYFRVFNPETQSKNFDPQGIFIKQYCPELKNYNAKHIHAPHNVTIEEQVKAKCKIGVDYPQPIVRHEVQRLKAVDMFNQELLKVR